jgi:Acyltransferase family
MTNSLQERGTPAIDLTAQLAATPSTRNRAIDAYRAIAMCAVALGHWIAADVRMKNGSLSGSNALNQVHGLHIVTWVFQVMPVFFLIGGYSNAASLDAHHRAGRSNADWVRARLLRLTTPSVWLAGTWLTVMLAGRILGFASLANMAVAVAAIPLWFLANYVADTALSPITLRWYRTYGTKFVGVLVGFFLVGEAARFPGIHYVPQMNIVLGWLLFQVLGFAWKDGRFCADARRICLAGVASWVVAATLVALGPWPLAMVSVPGARFANTWPPSLALMFHGLGMCCFAIAAAPRISAFLTRNARAWKAVVVANTMTMTSYLWHFTALSIAAVLLSRVNLLPTATAGTGAWWLQKVPLMATALVVLAGLIAVLAPQERKGLLGTAKAGKTPRRPLGTTKVAIIVGLCGFVLAAGFETWTAAEGNPVLALPGMIAVISVHATLRWLNRHSAT